jgi:tRNA-specific 2-thiouridylase
LGLSGPEPSYVIRLDPVRNAVVVGPSTALETERIIATDVNLIAYERLEEPLPVEVRIRHGAPLVPAELRPRGAMEMDIRLARPLRAVTPGQSVVFYRGELVVGGGVIGRAA